MDEKRTQPAIVPHGTALPPPEPGVRHVPVVVGEHALGIVGIRDVLRVLLERAYESHDSDAHDTARDLLQRPSLSSPAEGA